MKKEKRVERGGEEIKKVVKGITISHILISGLRQLRNRIFLYYGPLFVHVTVTFKSRNVLCFSKSCKMVKMWLGVPVVH